MRERDPPVGEEHAEPEAERAEQQQPPPRRRPPVERPALPLHPLSLAPNQSIPPLNLVFERTRKRTRADLLPRLSGKGEIRDSLRS